MPARCSTWSIVACCVRTMRTDRWYFELSHDSLVEPILATSRVAARPSAGWVGRRRALWACLRSASCSVEASPVRGQGSGLDALSLIGVDVRGTDAVARHFRGSAERRDLEPVFHFAAAAIAQAAAPGVGLADLRLRVAPKLELVSQVISVVRGGSLTAGSVLLLLLLSSRRRPSLGGRARCSASGPRPSCSSR